MYIMSTCIAVLHHILSETDGNQPAKYGIKPIIMGGLDIIIYNSNYCKLAHTLFWLTKLPQLFWTACILYTLNDRFDTF